MSQYHAPLKEMQFVMNELAGLEQVGKLPGFEDATPDTVAAILAEAAKFATEVLDPLNAIGDREGAFRSRRSAHARGAAARWQLQALRPEDLHHLRRARLHRQYHPSRPRTHAYGAGRREGHFAFHRAQVPDQPRRVAWAPQRRAM